MKGLQQCILGVPIFFVMTLAFFYLVTEDSFVFKLFNHLKWDILNREIDDVIIAFFSKDIMDVIAYLLRYYLDIACLMIFLSGVNYIISFLIFPKVTLPVIVICDQPWKESHKWLQFVCLYLPFILIYLYDFSAISILGILVTYILFILEFKYINMEIRKPTFMYVQILLIMIIVMIFLSFNDIRELNIKMLFWLPLISYIFSGISIGIFLLMKTLIVQEYQLAKRAKENLLIEEYVATIKSFTTNNPFKLMVNPIRRFRKVCTRKDIEDIISQRLNTGLVMRRQKLGELIGTRNKINCIWTICLCVMMWGSVCLAFNVNFFEQDARLGRLLVVFIMILFFRLVLRSIEIAIAFYQDIIKNTPKNSNLSGRDRLRLAIISLIEMTVLSAFISVFYNILSPSVIGWSLANYFELTLMTLLKHFSIQIFNVSFPESNDLFQMMVHVIQVTTSFCLIILAIASYLNLKKVEKEYEVTEENGAILLKEWIYVQGKNEQPLIYSKVVKQSKIGLPLDYSWKKGYLKTDDYIEQRTAYQEWIEWKEDNRKLKDYWLKYGLKTKEK